MTLGVVYDIHNYIYIDEYWRHSNGARALFPHNDMYDIHNYIYIDEYWRHSNGAWCRDIYVPPTDKALGGMNL